MRKSKCDPYGIAIGGILRKTKENAPVTLLSTSKTRNAATDLVNIFDEDNDFFEKLQGWQGTLYDTIKVRSEEMMETMKLAEEAGEIGRRIVRLAR